MWRLLRIFQPPVCGDVMPGHLCIPVATMPATLGQSRPACARGIRGVYTHVGNVQMWTTTDVVPHMWHSQLTIGLLLLCLACGFASQVALAKASLEPLDTCFDSC